MHMNVFMWIKLLPRKEILKLWTDYKGKKKKPSFILFIVTLFQKVSEPVLWRLKWELYKEGSKRRGNSLSKDLI